jgi:hypothetical protein
LSTITDNTVAAPEQAQAGEWRLRGSRGWQIPGAVAVVSLGLFTACLVYVFSKPIALATFVVSVAALSLLLLGYLAALFAYGCYSARYRLEPDLLAVEWLWMTEEIPLAAVDGIYSGRQMEGRPQVRGLVWPGHCLGVATVEGLGAVKFLGTSTERVDLLIVTTAKAAYALSPDNLEGFREALIERLEALEAGEAEQLPEPATHLPRLLSLSILRDGVALGLLAAATVVVAASYGYISAVFPSLPDLITLQFSQGFPLVVGPPADAFRMPMGGTAILALNALIAAALHRRQADSGRLLAGATLFVQMAILAAVIIVV